MAKRVIIIHGWSGFPEEGWFPWLKKELELRGFSVIVPQLPDTDNPRIDRWVPALSQAVSEPDEQTYFVGHSLGCQTIARYLAGLPEGVLIGGAVFIAGFFRRLTNVENDLESQQTQHHWLDTPIDLAQVKKHLKGSVAIFSNDDPYVPLDNQADFKAKLGSKIVIEVKKGHFSGSSGIKELPVALESVLELSK